jgi:hypothetical protein
MISYNDFLHEDLRSEEGDVYLRVATRLKNVFRVLANKKVTKEIAEEFLNNIRNPLFPVKISFLNLSEDKNDTVTFLPKPRIMKLVRENDKLGAYKSPLRQEMKIGRIIKQLFDDKFTNQQIEIFVNEFKGYCDLMTGKVDLKLVDGEDIAYWYHYSRYNKTGKGTLNNSCMRNASRQQLSVYVDNPKVCRLAILVNSDGLLDARALIWNTDKGIVMDRVYHTGDHIENAYIQYAEKHGWTPKKNIKGEKYTVQLHSGVKYRNYPYLDTFSYYDVNKNTLSTGR